jgi:hypothetical protein
MIMTPEEVREYCTRHPGMRALLIVPTETGGEQVIAAGPWSDQELRDQDQAP